MSRPIGTHGVDQIQAVIRDMPPGQALMLARVMLDDAVKQVTRMRAANVPDAESLLLVVALAALALRRLPIPLEQVPLETIVRLTTPMEKR